MQASGLHHNEDRTLPFGKLLRGSCWNGLALGGHYLLIAHIGLRLLYASRESIVELPRPQVKQIKPRGCSLNRLARFVVTLSVAVACCGMVAAQDESIPKVLEITREYTKPGRAGMIHGRSESAFVHAFARAKWPTYYLGMTSLSGRQRALFLTRYASFEAWEKDNTAVDKNAAFAAALDRASVADGEFLDSIDHGVFMFREEMSLRPMLDLAHMRYMEINIYQVKPGHDKEWSEIVKMVRDAYEGAVPEAHWGMYQEVYGSNGNRFIVLTARKSLAEIDRTFSEDNPKFLAAVGESGMSRLAELEASAMESSEHELFEFNPHMSYIAPDWIKEDAFWKPKPTAAPAPEPSAEEKKATP